MGLILLSMAIGVTLAVLLISAAFREAVMRGIGW